MSVSDHDDSIQKRSEEQLVDNTGEKQSLQTSDQCNVATFVSYSHEPADWDPDDTGLVEFIVSNPIKMDPDMIDFSKTESKDSSGTTRRATKELFYRMQINREKRFRDWLVFSKTNQTLYCLPCYFFGKSKRSLASQKGYGDWKNASSAIGDHEKSREHNHAIASFVSRSHPSSRIDTDFIKEFHLENQYWKNVLRRVVSVIKHLARRGLPFRGSDAKLGSPSNGNFLGCLELLAEYDPFLAKHLEQYGNKGKGNTSYLSCTICDEFIDLLGDKAVEFIGNY